MRDGKASVHINVAKDHIELHDVVKSVIVYLGWGSR